MNLSLVFAFVAFFGWGIGMLFEAIVGRKLESYSALLWGLLLGFLVSTFYAPFAIKDLSGLTPSLFLINLFVAFFWIVGTLIYYEALKKGNPSLVGTISNTFPAVIIVLSIGFLGERPTINQIFAIAIILIGIVLASLNLRQISWEKFKADKGIWLAILTTISWGVALAFIKIPVKAIGWFWPNYIIFSLFPLVFLYTKLKKIKFHIPSKSLWIALVLSVLFVRVAEYSYNFAISKGMTTVVAAIGGANPILFVPLTFLVFRESATKQQTFGIVVTLVGIVLLSIFSV